MPGNIVMETPTERYHRLQMVRWYLRRADADPQRAWAWRANAEFFSRSGTPRRAWAQGGACIVRAS